MQKIKMLYFKFKNQIRFLLNKNISSNILMGPNVQIFGLNNIVIEEGCIIGENSHFNVNNRTNKNIQLTLGKNTYIGRDNFFSVGKFIHIGEYCIFGNKCSFICSDHIFDTPLKPYAVTGNSFEKSIKIGVNCWLGHDVCVLGNVTIGHGCVIGAKTTVTKSIPPFSMVVGNPARIIKTYNFDKNVWEKDNLQAPNIYNNEKEYLNYLKRNYRNLSFGLHSASVKYGHI